MKKVRSEECRLAEFPLTRPKSRPPGTKKSDSRTKRVVVTFPGDVDGRTQSTFATQDLTKHHPSALIIPTTKAKQKPKHVGSKVLPLCQTWKVCQAIP